MKKKPALLGDYLKDFNYDFNKTGYTVNTFFSKKLVPDELL
jgi:hypothetical protein